MAELDWRIPLSGESPKINTPFENLDIVLRSKANQQKVQSNALELRQQTQDAEDRDAIRQIAQQYGNDPETMLTEITKRNPVLGMKMRADIQDQTIKGLTIDITKRKLHADKIDEHLTGLLSVRKGDDAAWQRQRAATMQEDPQVGSELPEHLLTDEDVTQRNAVAMKGMNARAILIKDLEEQNRVRDDARAAADLQRKADADAAKEANATRSAERMEAAQLATAGYQARMAGASEARAAKEAEGPPVAIQGPDGKPIYVTRRQAIGKTPVATTGAGVVIQTDQGPQLLNKGTGTVSPITTQGGESVKGPKPAALQVKEAAKESASRSILAVEELSRKVINKRGIAQRAMAAGRSVESALGSDPDYRVYQDARFGLAATLAVVQQGSRPSDMDVKAVWLPLVPDVFKDTDESAPMKWTLIRTMSGMTEAGTPPPSGGSTSTRIKFDKFGRRIP